MTQNVAEFRLNLLENGLDFVREGTEALYGGVKSTKPRDYKYALLHIFSGTLLILKERLRREHPSLIFKDVAHQGTPDAKTVDFEEVLRRLHGAAGVKLNGQDENLLRRVQKERNRLEHFEANIHVKHADKLVGELVDFLERFLRDELADSLFIHVSRDAGETIAGLAKIAQRLHARELAEWRKRAAPFRRLPAARLRDLADQGAYHPKHNPDGGLSWCDGCFSDTVALVADGVAICTNAKCREIHRTTNCFRCGGVSMSGSELCEDCTGYVQHQAERD